MRVASYLFILSIYLCFPFAQPKEKQNKNESKQTAVAII